MKHWNMAAVTDIGAGMLNDLLAGSKMVITSVYGGTEKAVELEPLADVCGERHSLGLEGLEAVEEGKTVKVQISNLGLDEGYKLHQIGIFARIDNGPEQLLCVYQDESGVDVPSRTDSPSFLLEFYGLIAITNSVEISVDLSQTGVVVTPQLLADALANHNRAPDAHPEIWRKLGKHVLATRVRASTKPDYGIIQENVQGHAVALDTAPYTGGSEVSAVVSGVEYDASNMSVSGADSPDGTLILNKSEE